jgi:hypothetical protein
MPTTPNTNLAAHLAEAGISHAALAHHVTRLAAARGLPRPAYNHASVARWLRGEQPRGPVPDLIAAALTAALGRRVTRADLGLRPETPAADLGLAYEADPGAALDAARDLYAADIHRRAALARGGYAAVAYVVPAIRWMTAPASALTERSGARRVGAGSVDAIREVTATFRRLDNQFGGGYARTTVVQYLADEVAPLLRHGAYTAEVGRPLFAAAAETTLLAGWMAYDLEQHAIAQRYLIQALRLAQEGGDDALGGEVLAAMSCQAAYLGEGADAVDMARCAALAARRASCAALESECLATEAHGHALSGSPRSCADALARAHRALDADSGERPVWLAYFDGAYLAAKQGRALLDAGDAAEAAAAMRASLGMQPGYERGRAFNLTVLASALVERGELEEGCAYAAEAAGAADELTSTRARQELAGFSRRITTYRGAAPVRALAASRPGLVSGSRAGRARPAGR